MKQEHFNGLLEKANRMYSEAGISLGQVLASPYELIIESDLSRLTDRLIFSVNQCDNGYITSIALNVADNFIFDRCGLYLLDTDDPSDIRFNQHTFPDRKYFKEECEIFYKAKLSLYINNALVMAPMMTDQFRIPLTVEDWAYVNSESLKDVGQAFMLIGTKNIMFRLDLPRKGCFEPNYMRVRLRLSGLLIMNTTF